MGESAVGAARAARQQCPLIHTPSQLLELRGLLTRLLGLPLEASSFLELGIGIGIGIGRGSGSGSGFGLGAGFGLGSGLGLGFGSQLVPRRRLIGVPREAGHVVVHVTDPRAGELDLVRVRVRARVRVRLGVSSP